MTTNQRDKDCNEQDESQQMTSSISSTDQATQPKLLKGLRLPAEIISYIFHPVFFPTVMLALICWLDLSQLADITKSTQLKWIGVTAFNTIFFPLFTVFLIWQLKFIKSIFLKTQRDRIIPLIAIMIYYFWAEQLFHRKFHAPLIVTTLFLGAFWGIILLFIGNIFLKVSMHTTAAGGVIGIMLILMFTGQINFLIPFLITLLFAGLIGTARMLLNAHTHNEIWLGYAAGFISQIFAYWFLK